MRFLARTTCRIKGHLWSYGGQVPDLHKSGGRYIVHVRCWRCGLSRKEWRQAVPFIPGPKE